MPWYLYGRAFYPRASRGVVKPGQWLPSKEASYWLPWNGKWILCTFQPHRGLYPCGLYRREGSDMVEELEFPSLRSKAMKKVSVGVEPGKPLPPLSEESAVLKRCPRLRSFLTATSYEGGELRAPGRLWLENDGVGFRVTLFEPSALARVALRAATLDDAFAMIEAFLGADSPPWEVDQWARDRAATKKKK